MRGFVQSEPLVNQNSVMRSLVRRTRTLLKTVGVLSFAVAGLSLSGCEKPQVVGGVPRSKFVKNVVSLSPSVTEVCLSAMLQPVGRTSSCNYPESTTKSIPVVADVKPNYEAIQKLNPDLVAYDRGLYSDQDIQKIKEMGFQTFEFKAQTLADYERELLTFASVAGVESNMNDYVERVHKAWSRVRGDKPTTTKKIAFLLVGSTGSPMIAGKKSFLADVGTQCGATVIGPDSDKFETLNAEMILSENPDVVFVGGDAKLFLKDARFTGVAAAKTGRVFGLTQDVMVRKGSRVDKLLDAVYRGLTVDLSTVGK
jgi:ABC-type Fe3+-hydroxamate transport system substrate-binding protein